jgi:hypothetical protein
VKHIENKYHKARDLVEKKLLLVRHVGNNGMVADVMNKGLGWVKFERFRSMLKVLPLSTCWSVERSHIKCIWNQWEFHLQGNGGGCRGGSHKGAGNHYGSRSEPGCRASVLDVAYRVGDLRDPHKGAGGQGSSRRCVG